MYGKQTLRFGPFQLDPSCGQVRRDGVGLRLQGQPVRILELLLEHPGELVSREEIRQRLWASDTFVDFDHSLNTAIKKLRQALGDEADTPRYIETLPKRGYRFIAEVDGHTTDVAPEECIAEMPVSVVPEKPGLAVRNKFWAHSRILKALAAVVSLLFSAAAIVYFSPIPMPRIVASHRLTNSGFPKSGLVTDGIALYFQETRPTGRVGMQMSVAGGEAAELVGIPDGMFRGVSRTRSELLLWVMTPDSSHEAWAQPLPAGPARLILKNAVAPIWTTDGNGLLFGRNDSHDLYYADADGTGVRKLLSLPDMRGVAVSPDGERIRIASQSGSPFRYNLKSWEARADGSELHVAGDDFLNAGQWTPDVKFYFYRVSDGEKPNLWVAADKPKWWYRKSVPPRQLTFGPLHIASAPVFSSNGKKVFVVGSEPRGELSVYDSTSKSWVPYLGGISASYVDFSPDGQWVAYVSYPEGNLWRSRVDGGDRMQLTTAPIKVFMPRWSPDGKLIAFVDLSGGDIKGPEESPRIYVVRAEGGGPLLLVAGQEGAGDPAWSPDGSAIAYHVVLPGTGRELRTIDVKTREWKRLAGAEGLWSARRSPDGRYIAALKGYIPFTLVLFDVSSHQQTELVTGAFLGWPSWSPDSKKIYFFDEQRIWRIDIRSGIKEDIADLEGFPNANVGDFAWFGVTPDGRPLKTRNKATDEIYSFDLEYK